MKQFVLKTEHNLKVILSFRDKCFNFLNLCFRNFVQKINISKILTLETETNAFKTLKEQPQTVRILKSTLWKFKGPLEEPIGKWTERCRILE